LEDCWHHILFKELNIKKSRNESPVLVAVPVQWTKLDHERITQIFFENFNVPGVYIAPQPLLALFGCGTVSGIVVDIGSQVTDVNVVMDSNIQPQSNFMIPIGGNHLDEYFLQLLQKDTQLVEQFNQHQLELTIEFAKYVRELPGLCHVVKEEANKDKEQDLLLPALATEEILEEDTAQLEEETIKELPECVEVEYKGHKFSIGKYRHQVADPLFLPELVGLEALSLPEAIRLAVMNCEPPEIRPKLWETMVLAGGCCLTSGLNKRIKTEAQIFLPQSDNAGDTQPRMINFLKVPDYFTVLKERQYQLYSTWLGAEIVAKLVFIDAKNYISKVDYNEFGPSVIHTKAY
ncbi:hypothetical protein CU098_005976, partial [Rhizopus stolonifer]